MRPGPSCWSSIRPKAVVNPSAPNPLQAIAGPHRLPQLLSVLPKSGLHSVIQPARGESTSYYLVTRPKLRYKYVKPREEGDERPVGRDGVPFARRHKLPWVDADPTQEGGEMKVFGSAHVMRFKNGFYQRPNVKSTMPDPRLKHAGAMQWIAIDPATIPSPEDRAAIESWKEAYDKQVETRNKALAEQKERYLQSMKDKRVKEAEKRENLRAWQEEKEQVKIFY